MSIDEIKKLNSKEKVILMNDIWESFESDNTIIESPKWHQEILQDRINRMKNNTVKYISLEELKNR